MGIKKVEEDVEEEYEMFLRDQKVRERQRASTLRPNIHGHPGKKTVETVAVLLGI